MPPGTSWTLLRIEDCVAQAATAQVISQSKARLATPYNDDIEYFHSPSVKAATVTGNRAGAGACKICCVK